ncbi:MAG: hypothetical protein GXY87_07790 [Tissierellia bacterium]|nr:hypothetical protein [Tissierellia bacterium]
MQEFNKNQIRMTIVSSVFLVLTIIVILLEDVMKKERFYSLIMLGLSFLLLGITQIVNYRSTKRVKNIILALIYIVIGIVNLVLIFTR